MCSTGVVIYAVKSTEKLIKKKEVSWEQEKLRAPARYAHKKLVER